MRTPLRQTISQAQLLEKIRCLLLDVDGTIIRGHKPTPGAGRFFQILAQTARSYLVVTNNDAISLNEHAGRLQRAGLPVEAENILSSAEVAADFLAEQWKCRAAMVLGAPALRQALLAKGLRLTDENPECMVVGFDTELSYERLKQACFLIERGCRWLATHPDVAMPGAEGFWPDCGAITAAISLTTGREPDIVLGKPGKYMAAAAVRRCGFSPEQIMMVGDRIETDVLFARENGMRSALVLTGAADRTDAQTGGADLVMDDLAQLADMLKPNRDH